MYSSQYNSYSNLLGRSTSHGFLPDLDAPISYLSSLQQQQQQQQPLPPPMMMENEMEERQRLEREKQKLLFGSTMDAHSPIQSYSKPTDVTRINHSSTFDGLYVPYSSSSSHHHDKYYSMNHTDLYEDPWASRKKELMEWPSSSSDNNASSSLPPFQPDMMKSNSYVNPFHTDVAPSLVFPADAPQHHDISPDSSLEDPLTPVSFIMSDEEDDIQPHKRQRGEHHTIYVKQEPEDQDITQQQPFIDYIQQIQIPQQTMAYQQTYDLIQPNMSFTLQEQQQHQAPVYQQQQQQQVYQQQQSQSQYDYPIISQSIPSSPVSVSAPMTDSSDDEDNKRKRKTSTKRKSQPIGTHAIENTGAPVKMAKYLHVDGMTTQVWIEHATYQENGVTTDIRLIMYAGAFNGVVVHAGDVGERIVCNRRSNISREFGQYASPTEKILIRVPSEHRPLGQTGNVLTGYGLIRFMQSKKMRKPENQNYRRWLLHHVYQILVNRPFTFPKGHTLECQTIPSTPFTETDFSH